MKVRAIFDKQPNEGDVLINTNKISYGNEYLYSNGYLQSYNEKYDEEDLLVKTLFKKVGSVITKYSTNTFNKSNDLFKLEKIL